MESRVMLYVVAADREGGKRVERCHDRFKLSICLNKRRFVTMHAVIL